MRPFIVAACALATACASSPSHPAAVAQETPAPPPAATPAAPAGPSRDTEAYDDPGELQDPAIMTPLFSKATRPSFPKATASDRDCWQAIRLSGEARKDYDALVASCGTPTGSVQYVAPIAGKLHHRLDKRDTFDVKIQGGLCYRFFGVADASIPDLDILIERSNGDLVGDDKTNGPVAIIDADKNWCMDNDGDFRFHVQIEGAGTGNYEFGVWARPKK
jgi:hypothetical protein